MKPKGYSENGESMQFLKFINSCLSGCNNISWNCYKNPWFAKDILDPVSAKKFIQQIFKNGEKFLPLLIDPSALKFFTDAASLSSSQEIFLHSNPNDQYSLPDFRATHTVSGFFLGFLIEHCLTGNNTLSVTHPDTFPFSYFWFLTFLYHDFGYCVSEKEDAPLSLPTNVPGTNHSLTIGIEEYRVLRQVKNKLNICLSPFSSIGKTHSCHSAHSPVNEKRTLLQELTQKSYRIKGSATLRFNTGTQIHGCQYTSTVVTRYFNYCAKCLETLDHGIIGGYLFYDRMIKNYVRAYFSARQTAGRQISLSDFTHKGRHFSEKQLIDATLDNGKYFNWAKNTLLKYTHLPKEKKNIEAALRCFLPELIMFGYDPDFISTTLQTYFFKGKSINNDTVKNFLDVFDLHVHTYTVYFSVSSIVQHFRTILADSFNAIIYYRMDDG